MKYIAMSLAALVLVMLLFIPTAYFAAYAYVRMTGSNWYEYGCIDGVEQYYLANSHAGGQNKADADKVNLDYCFKESKVIRKRGGY